jgi:hypothetical protein
VHPVFAAASTQTRGKEREIPKKKKLSVTKKIVLKERQERKEKEKEQNGESPVNATTDGSKECDNTLRIAQKEENQPTKPPLLPQRQAIPSTPPRLLLPHFLPHKDTSPSPQHSPLPSPQPEQFQFYSPHCTAHSVPPYQHISSLPTLEPHHQTTPAHSLRPYITHKQLPELDSLAYQFISTLHQFEVNKKKALGKNSLKFKKRLVAGLREVSKKLDVHKVKCVIASPSIPS